MINVGMNIHWNLVSKQADIGSVKIREENSVFIVWCYGLLNIGKFHFLHGLQDRYSLPTFSRQLPLSVFSPADGGSGWNGGNAAHNRFSPGWCLSSSLGAASWSHFLWNVCLQPEQRHHGQRYPGLVLRHGQHGHRALHVSASAQSNVLFCFLLLFFLITLNC